MEKQKDLPLPQKDLPRPEKELAEGDAPKPPIKPISKNKWIVFIVAALAILFATLIGGFLLEEKNAVKPVACTAEAKICPDGSSVGRSGPKCEFTACPKTPTPTPFDTSDWKTYTSPDNTFSFKYPENLVYKVYANAQAGDKPALKGTSVVFGHSITNQERKSFFDNVTPPDTMPDFSFFYSNDEYQSFNLRDFIGSVDEGIINKTIIILDQNTQATAYKSGCQDVCGSIVFKKGGRVFDLTGHSWEDGELPLLEKVVSTFKFTDSADTSTWKTYTMPTEKLSFKYPADWTLTPGAKVGTKECGTNGCNVVDSDNVTINGPKGLEIGIGQGNETIDKPYRKGTPCPNPADTCTNYFAEPITIAEKNLYLVISGYEYAGQEQMELGISTYSDCIMSCRAGLGKAKHQPGNIQAFAQYPSKYNLTPSEFMKDPNVKKAEEIFKSLSY